ncbi:hypothetical protein HCH54_001276 [Aspergillus fumigatus]
MVLDEAGDTRKGPTTPYAWFIMARKGVIDAEIPVSDVLRDHKTKSGADTSHANGE